jgi:lysyl-tRNA synthetase class 2
MTAPPTTRPATPRWARVPVAGRDVARAVGNATYVIGAIDVVTGLLHSWRLRLHPLTEVVPGALSDAAAAATVVSGLLLLLLAHSLKRRKVRAWRAATALLVVSLASHALKLEVAAALVSVLGLVLLVTHRREFFAAGDPSTRWRAVLVGLTLGTSSFVLGVVAIAVNADDVVGGWPGLSAAVQHTALGLVGTEGPVTFTSDRHADVIAVLLGALGLMTMVTTVAVALRSPERRPHLSDGDDARVRELLEVRPDSLGYFNLRRDKSVVWSPSGKAAVCYRVVSGVMLASGDPLGDEEAWPGAIREFMAEAARHAWTPAVLGCSERGGTVWCRETGLTALELGDEAVIDVQSFSLEGRAMRNVRQMVARVRRHGYEAWARPVARLTDLERGTALRDAEAWRGSDTERGFSMALGRVADPRDPDALLVVAHQEGVVRGLLQFVPWGRDGLSLDVMRRDRSSDPGVNDLLIVEAVEAARELGVRRISLNFAAFRSVLERGERLGAGPVLRLVRRLLLFASRWFQIESLYRFNAKFQPDWQPRFVVFPTARDLPRVVVAAMEAEAFLTWPRLRLLGGAT